MVMFKADLLLSACEGLKMLCYHQQQQDTVMVVNIHFNGVQFLLETHRKKTRKARIYCVYDRLSASQANCTTAGEE